MNPGLRRKMSRVGQRSGVSIIAAQAAHPVKPVVQKRERRTSAREISEAQLTGQQRLEESEEKLS